MRSLGTHVHKSLHAGRLPGQIHYTVHCTATRDVTRKSITETYYLPR